MNLRRTQQLLTQSEQLISPIGNALASGGMRLAGVDIQGGLADRFMAHNSVLGVGAILQPSGMGVPGEIRAHTCPRCKRPSSLVRLASGANVRYCENGCRYAIPLPGVDLIKNN